MLTRATRISDYTAIDYKYDADGRRIEKKVTNGDGIVQKLTKYYYTDGALTTEVNYTPNNGTMTAETKVDYIYDNTGLAFVMVELYNNDNYYVSAGKYTFYVKRNAQGDVTSLIDITNGNMGDGIQYTYSAYGRMYIENTAADLCMLISDVNTLTFKSYSYDSDLGMYYLGSRWYDPEVCRFINADSYVKTPTDSLLSTNMFAYCENNPVNKFDPTGDFAITATLGGAALFKIGAAVVGLLASFFAIDTLVKDPPAIPSFSLPKFDAKPKTDSETKDIAPSKPKDSPKETVIYRYGGTNPGNLTPKVKDKYTGLSFSTIPQPGAAMTTIEALNATGLVYAVRDNVTHVSVRPVGGTMEDWINAGADSVWTQAVKSVVIKWDGVN